MMRSNLLRTSVGWGILVVLAQSCGADEETERRTSAISSSDRPAGLVCGLAYSYQMVQEPGVWPLLPALVPVDGKCDGNSTIKASPIRVTNNLPGTNVGGPTAQNYGFAYLGDNGLPWYPYLGYQNQFLGIGSQAAEDSPGFLSLPQGTACGFSYTCGDHRGTTCMGYNPQVSCPSGWQQRQAGDAHASNGCNFAWCEYQDPHGACPGSSCFNLLPKGLTCGITDSDYPNTHPNPKLAAGQCQGVNPKTPNTCPSGWQWYGRFDAGRSAGHGLAWCSKL